MRGVLALSGVGIGLAVAIAGTLGYGVPARGTIPSATGVFHGCYQAKRGTMRIVDEGGELPEEGAGGAVDGRRQCPGGAGGWGRHPARGTRRPVSYVDHDCLPRGVRSGRQHVCLIGDPAASGWVELH